jgi:hypothetical protein
MAANVMLLKCVKNGRSYGVRVEKRGNDWVSTWAFPIADKKAKSEGYDKVTIVGSLDPVDEFPGCPHCGDSGFFQCSCGKMTCYSDQSSIKCPWCGENCNEIRTVETLSVKSGGD